MQDKDLSQYSPSFSSTSKHLPCSHNLCKLSTNCKGPKEPCPYIAEYVSENTSSSGFLVEDKLHLASVSDHAAQNHVQASVILGCVYIVCLPFSLLFSFIYFFWDLICIDFCLLMLGFLYFLNFISVLINAAVVGNKVVSIWMELPLMV